MHLFSMENGLLASRNSVRGTVRWDCPESSRTTDAPVSLYNLICCKMQPPSAAKPLHLSGQAVKTPVTETEGEKRGTKQDIKRVLFQRLTEASH